MDSRKKQQQFDFPRAAKLNVLERARCSPKVKALLKALDGFVRDNDAYVVTIARIAESMSFSDRSVRYAIREAQRLGLLQVETSDRSANRYRIDWQAVFALPDGIVARRKRSRFQTPTAGAEISAETERPDPLQNLQPPPAKFAAPPADSAAPPAKFAGASDTDHLNDQSSAAVADQVPGFSLIYTEPKRSRWRDGGRGGGRDSERERRSGWWAGYIDRNVVSTTSGVNELFQCAVSAGLIDDRMRNQVRVLALCLQAIDQARESIGGYIVRRIEDGDWNMLGKKYVDEAARRLGINLDAIQRNLVCTPDFRGESLQ